MKIEELLDENNVTLAIIPDALREFAEYIIAKTREEAEAGKKSAEAEKREVSAVEAAHILNRSKKTLWRWEKEGYLRPVRRIGKTPMYSVEDLKKLGKKFYVRKKTETEAAEA